ncbi:MAG: carbohydrate ABC transporter permease [Ruminococcus flavefaciens]|nr:MAG: L-arabinose transport system permease protein AraQ [Firmicutes bacterium ADurb.BinA205]HOC34699.1 carbohydrate ABC transporter permease [Ruminococcus flavefaciens]HQM00401.1 carbohydrate ABC transporter permease [Ruminococcus flavefaciens]
MISLKKQKKAASYAVWAFIFTAALLFLLPTVLTLANSFMTSNEISANYGALFGNMTDNKKVFISENVNLKFIPDKVTLDQYKAVLITNSDYLMKFWNSVMLTVPITVFQLAVAILTSYGFARYPGKIKSIIFFAYIILMIMPYQVTLVPNFLVADKFGILNTRASVILPAVFSPFSIFLLTKVMKRIPVSYVEAAKLDGAGELQILTKIYLPLCKSAIISVAMLVFIDYWNMVEQPLVLMNDQDYHPLSVFLSQINTGDIGLAFAVGTVYMVPTILMFLYGEDYLVEGITTSGGIKG